MGLPSSDTEATAGSQPKPAEAEELMKDQSRIEEELIPVGEMFQSTHLIGQEAVQLAGYALTHNWSLLVDKTKAQSSASVVETEPNTPDSEITKGESSNETTSPAKTNKEAEQAVVYTQRSLLDDCENEDNVNEISFESTIANEEDFFYNSEEDEGLIRSKASRPQDVVSNETPSSNAEAANENTETTPNKAPISLDPGLTPMDDLFRNTHLIGVEAAGIIHSAVQNGLQPCMESACGSPENDAVYEEGIELKEGDMMFLRENSIMVTPEKNNEALPHSVNENVEEEKEEDTKEVQPKSGAVRARKEQLMSNLSLIRRRSSKTEDVQDHHIIDSHSVEVIHNIATSPTRDGAKKRASVDKKEDRPPSSMNKRAEAARNFILNHFSKSNKPGQVDEEPGQINPQSRPKPQKPKRENRKSKEVKKDNGRPKRITRTFVNIPPPPVLETKASQETMSTENTHGSNVATLQPTFHSPEAPDDELMAQNTNDEIKKKDKDTLRILRVIKPEREQSQQQQPTLQKDRSLSPRPRPASPDANADSEQKPATPSPSQKPRAASTPRRQTLRMSTRNKSLTQKPVRSQKREI